MGIHEIPKDIVLYDNIIEYMSRKMGTLYPHDQQPNTDEFLRECSVFLTRPKTKASRCLTEPLSMAIP